MEGKQLTKAEKQIEKLREWQNDIAEKAYRVIAAATEAHFHDDDLDPNILTPEEIEEAGSVKEAKAKKRLIRDLKKNRSEAPIYLTHSQEIVKGYEKMLANRQVAQGNTLNVAVFIQDKSSDPTIKRAAEYDVIDILPEEKDY